MGFFAVTSRYSSNDYQVIACHLSLWVLAKPWYLRFQYGYFFDVGLRLKPQKDLYRIRIALPFDTDKKDITDLSSFVIDTEFSPLIFGRPVTIQDDYIVYDASSVSADQKKIKDKVVAVSVSNSTPGAEKAKDIGYSSWTIEFDKPLPANETSYVRFRFKIQDPSNIWLSKGWGLAKRGAIADLRVADIRESLVLGDGKEEANFIKEIEQVFLFVISPSNFVPKHVSPNLHYSRLLEPAIWNRYLSSCGKFDVGTKFSIHQWRSTQGSSADKKAVDADNPFRVYADFSREFGLEILVYYAFGILAFPVLSGAARYIYQLFGISL